MAWDSADFVVAGVLVGSVAGIYILATRRTRNRAYRSGTALALAAAFLLIWLNLAVGIIGSEDNPANLMYAGVLGGALIGALLARFRPHDMARAMSATALAQALVALIALAARAGPDGPKWPWDLLALTAFFVGLWLTSASLYRRSSRQLPPRPTDSQR